ncbi:hypothetical protein [Synechococcus sp. A15-24]|uniref:hypothetical protein n=1 Tax=Synechococcus sp. A15-24 TaxID=1050635 RepID=UPI001647C577|nr:hypothetical protein [Synechococcus sp. A15-24]QNJ27804.1 hypothetical protein SynA1524_00081 [Synechococcus sp. A15-24]
MYPNWINSPLINTSILSEQFLKIGFSQNGEDEIIREFFWNDILSDIKGTYLDIGCYHETLYSNTKLLNLAGWNGVAIDANPDLESHWKNIRRADTFFNLGIKSSQVNSEFKHLKFFRFKAGAINTFDKNVARTWVERGFEFRDMLDIECKTLPEISNLILSLLPNFSPAFLNIDIEQVNYLSDLSEFLKSMNNPRLVCIEWVSQGFGIDNYKESMEYHLLSSSGYKVTNIMGGNLFAAYVK